MEVVIYTRTGAFHSRISIFIPFKVYLCHFIYICTLNGIILESKIADFIKERRKQLELTQPELAERAGVGLRFIRELEQGKQTVRLDKVDQVLHFFGSQLGVVEMEIV